MDLQTTKKLERIQTAVENVWVYLNENKLSGPFPLWLDFNWAVNELRILLSK